MTFDRKSQADLLTVVLRGTAWTVPRALVRRVDFAGPVTPLPFAVAPVEGLTMVDGKPLLQMRPAEDAGQPAQPGDKLLVIDTATGPVALRADRIAAGLPSAPALILDGLPADYVQAPAAAAESAARPAAGARPLTLLFAVMGGETVAFPAAIIERVDHVVSLRALDGDPSGLKLAALEGELVPARPGAPCFGGDGAGDTAWALVVARGDERLALLASRVSGLREVPPSRLRRVPVPGGRPSFWVHTEEGGLARLADPRLWVWPDEELAPCLAGFREEPAKVAQWSGIGEYRGGLCLRAGGLRISLPLATVSQVLGRLDRLAEAAPISRRRPRGKALPVLDVAVLLGRRER
ncbi:MAG: hypothetical protein K2Q10_00360, partial [Rhodospirillales bacterium]|nr:hypothetical protein [Rhodospirillales bacterium]